MLCLLPDVLPFAPYSSCVFVHFGVQACCCLVSFWQARNHCVVLQFACVCGVIIGALLNCLFLCQCRCVTSLGFWFVVGMTGLCVRGHYVNSCVVVCLCVSDCVSILLFVSDVHFVVIDRPFSSSSRCRSFLIDFLRCWYVICSFAFLRASRNWLRLRLCLLFP